MRFFAVVFNLVAAASYAYPPEVPKTLNFAGMVLKLSEAARRDIQRDVDALHHNEKYFNMKVERAKTYFPIIEKIFRKEGLPLDFKYLALQESSLIGDAVSTSNAVGFWQFKDNTAREIGLRVDDIVDERMSIVSSTIGAARYLKRSNQKLDNWVHSLQSYQMGLGGVMRLVGDQGKGKLQMEISNDTYWYVKKFIAFKTAFEEAMVGEPQFKVALQMVQAKKLADIINETGHDEKVLRDLNKWIMRDVIPDDKSYFVVIPLYNIDRVEPQLYAVLETDAGNPAPASDSKLKGRSKKLNTRPREMILINGVTASYVYANESMQDFAKRMDISKKFLVQCNDLEKDSRWKNATYYFVEKKKKIGEKDATYVLPGENWWMLSQRTGVKLKKLLRYNRQVELAEGKKIRLKPKPVLGFLSSRKEEILVGNINWDKPKAAQEKERKPVATPPVGNPVVTSPVENPVVTSPVGNPVASSPVKNPVASSPVENPAVSSPMENPVVSPSVENPVVTSPVENPVVSSSVENPAVSSPVETTSKSVAPALSSPQDSSQSLSAPKPDSTEYMPEHIVQAGETPYGIAKKHSLPVDSLIKWNNIAGSIHAGDKLMLQKAGKPVAEKTAYAAVSADSKLTGAEEPKEPKEPREPKEPKELMHEVIAGETLFSIARTYSVSVKDLMAWNKKSNYSVNIGDKLKIKP